MTALALADAADQRTARLPDHRQSLRRCAARARSTTFSISRRSKRGGWISNDAEFELRETVGDAAKLLALRGSEKGLELACHIAADVPDVLLGDPGRLRQVLLNVMGNAVKFTAEGEVVLRVDVESVRTRRMRRCTSR